MTNITRNEPPALGMIPVPPAALHEKQVSGEEPVRPVPVIQAVILVWRWLGLAS